MKNKNLVGKLFNVEVAFNKIEVIKVVTCEVSSTNIKGQSLVNPTAFYAIDELKLKYINFYDKK